MERNLHPHRQPGYVSLTISLKPIGGAPGDATAAQMDAVADLAERYSFDELRVTHEQNLVLPHVKVRDLTQIFAALVEAGLAEGNAGLITDIIACPGMDFCALATARSIPIAQAISEKFAEPARQKEIGELKIKISGCINACGHHHVGHIGILGVEKKGGELYQITVGGDATENAAVGRILGPGFVAEAVPDAIERLVGAYLSNRSTPEEPFIAAFRRLAMPRSRRPFMAMSSLVAPAVLRPDKLRALGIVALNGMYDEMDALGVLRQAAEDLLPGDLAIVSSFGADSAVLLHLVAQVDPSLPVYFLETGKHFPETLAYVETLRRQFGLTNLVALAPDEDDLRRFDPDGVLWETDPDSCCHIRKTEPLNPALTQFGGWVTGRKRYQTSERGRAAPFRADQR